MRILFSSRPNLESQPGGDVLHLEETAKALRAMDHEVVLFKPGVEVADFDIIHHFNLGRPAEALRLLRYNKPLIISSIFVDFEKADRRISGWRKLLSRTLSADALEYLKLLGRALSGREKWPPWYYIFQGHRASIQKLLAKSSRLICASREERALIESLYGCITLNETIHLGHEHLPKASIQKESSEVLCIARFERLKNQERLIEALNTLNLKANLVGETSPGQAKYRSYCQSIAGPHIHFHARATVEECAAFYQGTKVHVLPSLYESTGLVSIEALISGCQIVVNDDPIQRELFEDHAFTVR